jgi:small subunit ribosomal protein S20
MPNHKSAIKRVRRNEKRRVRNRHVLSTTRTLVKRVRNAIASGDAAAAREALPAAVRALSVASSKGVIHSNQASRKISRLTLAVNKLEA